MEDVPRGIAGLTDKSEPTRLGYVKIGIKVPTAGSTMANPKERPEKIDYMRFVDKNLDVVPGLPEYLQEENKPREFEFYFPSDNPDDFWDPAMRLWGSRKLKCRGDNNGNGLNMETGETVVCPCKQAESVGTKAPQCSATAKLLVVLPEVPGIGVFQIDTKGKVAIKNIQSTINMLQGYVAKLGGHLSGLRLVMKIYKFKHAKGDAWAWQITTPFVPDEMKTQLEGTTQLSLDAPAQIDQERPIPEAMIDIPKDDDEVLEGDVVDSDEPADDGPDITLTADDKKQVIAALQSSALNVEDLNNLLAKASDGALADYRMAKHAWLPRLMEYISANPKVD